ncbi:hypothetical protein [Polaromonas sp. P5_D5]
MKQHSLAAALALSLVAATASAQTIERVKMTDNDLTCQQIYGEIGQMDSVVTRAAQYTAAPATADPTDAGSQVAGAVVQTALATAAANTAAQNAGGFGGFGGGLGGMFGGIVQQLAGNTAQQAANSGVAQQQAATAQQQAVALQGQQAQGRKEHLTGVFLAKGCKMSDIQK